MRARTPILPYSHTPILPPLRLCASAILLFAAGRCTAVPVSYKTQIAPIFAANCNACHSAKTPQSGLTTGTYAALMKGGARGKTVIPANPDSSLLIQYIEGKKQPRMPVGGALKPAEIALIRRWISEGAKSDGEAGAVANGPGNAPLLKNVLSQVAALAWSKDGKILAAGIYREVKLFDGATGKPIRTLPGHADVARALAFSPDGSMLAAAGGVPGVGGEVKLWKTADWTPGGTLEGHTDCIYGLGWRPDGKQVATASYDKTVKLWDVAKAVSTAELKDHADAVYAAVYSSDGKYLATASGDRSIRVWDAAAGKHLYTLAGHTEMVTALAFHPTADQLASVSADKILRIWNLKPDGGEVARIGSAQADVLTAVAYSPDGKWIATTSNDGSVKLWDPAKTDPVRALPPASEAVLSVCFSPDSQRIAVGGYDGSLRLYRIADGTQIAALITPPKRAADFSPPRHEDTKK